jgi:chromosome segregation protein
MGELSARHLRGESMADVVFNGSSARKPLGAASVELLFDNSDGKIGGAYAGFTEISLKRVVSRDGTSGYFINGGRCRRKDITQLFLGTGLGSRSYAIIEQGMISRVIEARADDMRAFIEEAAGISLYKERRRETEARIADTRENLARLQDLRDEVDKQIRHLQRQASATRRYQELRAQQRQLTAELLAMRLRAIDSGAEVHTGAQRQAELAMQESLADQRSSEAAIERQRVFQGELSEALARVQGQYYELGAQVTRTEEAIRYTSELRGRQRTDLTQAGEQLRALALQIGTDQSRLQELSVELQSLTPDVDRLRGAEQQALAAQSQAERSLADWQARWEGFNAEQGAAGQSMQVEAARIEQLESQLLRLRAHSDRLDLERESLGEQSVAPLSSLSEREAGARQNLEDLHQRLATSRAEVQDLRARQNAAEGALEAARRQHERTRAELLSLEALQRASLTERDARAAAWLQSLPGSQTRVAELLQVDPGWERAVETVLGDYLEAVSVGALDELAESLASLRSGSVGFVEAGAAAQGTPGSLAGHVRAPAAVLDVLAGVSTCESLAGALQRRQALAAHQSLITPQGEWLGRNWLRVRRGGDPHSGVLEREQRLKVVREATDTAQREQSQAQQEYERLREQAVQAEQAREATQAQLQNHHQQHSALHSELQVLRARLDETQARRLRLTDERDGVMADTARAQQGLVQARAAHDAAVEALQRLDARRPELDAERDAHRESATRTRAAAQAAQLAMRDALVRLESRRTAHESMLAGLERLEQQQRELDTRRESLEQALADGDAPIRELEQQLRSSLAQRLDVEAELSTARQSLEQADGELRTLDLRRLGAEQRVAAARAELETARLAAQESRLRREALLEQFVLTRCDLAQVTASLTDTAAIEPWEQRLSDVDADIEKLGQVNLAAIDELKEQTERKQYLDRQYTDVNDALQTLDGVMRKIEKETRSRFEDTFNRINAGLQEKFPRLFGGGHAYLQMEGDDPLQGGVAVMARPPGKRNSTISQLSGGEKALTAVALVFSIFDLNPAPFCLLDEVDAPLDEHNVGRFCDIVREMSSRVQFIFITHNKVTMELAAQLIGVTMNEPGVSRLVAVDIDEAMRMAAV